ncbi:hypothetical protein ACIBW9_36785 [Streptomyces sp. NPDC049541]|uniref:hypothetical protein n=1 Tax=Streptomyces sp. NPDC049541 TaxID=3365594 RepID=UPI0037A9934B
MSSIWDRYPDLSPHELRDLVAATAQVLADFSDRSELPTDPIEMSTGEAARELTASIDVLSAGQRGVVQELLEDDETAVRLCQVVLDEVRRYRELADAVAKAYEERTRKMTGAEVLLLAGAVVVLATRIKEIKVGKGKEGTKITFSESGEAIKKFLAGLVSGLWG